MLKKIYQKNGIIFTFPKNEDIDVCYFIMNNYEKNKTIEEYKKSYYQKKGLIYPQLN